MRLAVAGGTGLIGRLLVDAARRDGHEVVVLARSQGIDLTSGPPAQLTERLAGVDALVDVSNVGTMSVRVSTEFFTAVTRHLLAAEQEAGVGHHLALSIVGVGRAPFGYYAGKRAQEREIEAGRIPWTILRATQFHEFAAQLYGMLRVGPLHLAPAMRTQPIAAREVAERLLKLAAGPPQSRIVELGGPAEESLPAMVRAYARARGSRLPIPAVPVPGALGRAQRDGTLLPPPGAERGEQPFADWLQSV